MTKQEIFNIVYVHAIRQGEKAIARKGMCVYRGKGGLKCFAGCLMPDDIYSLDMEGHAVSDSIMRGVWEKLDMTQHIDFIEELQGIHDNCSYEPEDWDYELDDVAREHGLEMPSLREA